jgi:hypothetical protein
LFLKIRSQSGFFDMTLRGFRPLLLQYRRHFANLRTGVTKQQRRIYRASKKDCSVCPIKERCCPESAK